MNLLHIISIRIGVLYLVK